MNVSEALYGAADHIATFGHHKGSAVGAGVWGAAPTCMVGGIVMGARHDFVTQKLACDAMTDYLAHLRVGVVAWNDAPERTATEVVEALRAAAVIAAARESAAQPAPVAVLASSRVGSGS